MSDMQQGVPWVLGVAAIASIIGLVVVWFCVRAGDSIDD